MLIIPSNSDKARPLLEQVRTQRAHCTMFVLLAGEEGTQLASVADVRAENHPFRKVVLIPNKSVLPGASGFDSVVAAADGGAIVCVMTFDFRVSSTLTQSDTIDLLAIEEAFIKAEVGR